MPIIQNDGTFGTVPFVYGRGIFYWDSGAKTANTEYGQWQGNAWIRKVNCYIAYDFLNAHNLKTVDYNTKVYLKCSVSGITMTPVGLTTALPTTADGYYYVFLIKPYAKYSNTTVYKDWVLDIEHPIYTYRNGKVVEVVSGELGCPDAYLKTASVSGNTLTLTKQDDTTVAYTPSDTGATSVEVTGGGNAVTAASYNSSNRKITLTKGSTYIDTTSSQTKSGNFTETGNLIIGTEIPFNGDGSTVYLLKDLAMNRRSGAISGFYANSAQ